MPRKNRRLPPQVPDADVSLRTEDSANQAVAEFSKSLILGEVSEEKRKRLVLLTPDPPPEVLAQYPEIAEARRTVERLLFHGTNLSDEDQKIVALTLRRRGFSAFKETMRLMSRLPGIQDQVDDLVQRGVPKRDLVAALLMTPQELQHQALRALPLAKQALGQRRGHFGSFLHTARGLGLDADVLRLLELDLAAKADLLARAEKAIHMFEEATAHLARKSKTPLISSPRVRVTQLLIDRGLPRAEAFRTTARLLRSWHPTRFQGLIDLQVRRSYDRHVRGTRR